MRGFKDPGLRLLCLALAVFLWWVVFRSGSREVEIALNVPVELANLPSALHVAKRPRDTVEVRVRGPRRVVARVPDLGLVLPLDLSRAGEGETTFRLRPGDLRLPELAEAVRITPSSLPVALERMVSAKVRLRVPLQGIPEEGYTVLQVVADPVFAEVWGPRAELAALREVATTPLEVSGAGGTVTGEVVALPPGGGLKLSEPGLQVKATAVLNKRKGP